MPGKIFSFWSSSEANLVINPFQPSIAFHIKTSHLCCPHIWTSQLICFANQLTVFYFRATLVFNGLMASVISTSPYGFDYYHKVFQGFPSIHVILNVDPIDYALRIFLGVGSGFIDILAWLCVYYLRTLYFISLSNFWKVH